MTLEDDLRSALHHHADRVEPASDGLSRIEARLAAEASTSRPRLAPRLMAAAAVLLVVGVVGAMTFRSDGTADVNLEVASPSTEPADPAEIERELAPLPGQDDDAATSSVEESNGAVATGTTQIDDIPAAPPGILGPRAITPEAAVDAFLGLIQRDGEDVMVDRQGELALVSRIGEGGTAVDVTTLTLGSVELSDGTRGFVVVEATSPRMVLDAPARLATSVGPTLTVSGQGEGFEGTVVVELYSSRDGVWLNQANMQAGNFGELAPFSTDLAVSGPGPVWVVAQTTGGTDTNLEPFSARPVVVDAPRAEPSYIVTNIPADDPDGGLVVRSLPGTDGEPLDVLPAGQRSINRRAALSAFLGDGEPNYGLEPVQEGQQEWWNIWLPEPLEDGRQWGWVNSNFLTADVSVEDAALEAVGFQIVDGLRGNDEAFATIPWADEVTFGLSNDLKVTTGGKAALPEFWQDPFSFALPPDFGGTLDDTLRVVLSPTGQLLASETAVDVEVVAPADMSPYAFVNAELTGRFPGASVVQLSDPTNDGSGWWLINVFVQQGTTGPEVVGMVNILWTP